MPWVYKQPPKAKHVCFLPGALGTKNRQPGDIWQCRQCSARWKLTKPGVPGFDAYPDRNPEWEKAT